jgi:hypothetical protein
MAGSKTGKSAAMKSDKTIALQGNSTATKKPGRGWTVGGVFSNLVTLALCGYSLVIAHNFYRIFHPHFPDVDENSGRTITKFNNRIRPGTRLRAQIFVSDKNRPPPKNSEPAWEFEFPYDWNGFESQSKSMKVTVPPGLLDKEQNVRLYAYVGFAAPAGKADKAGKALDHFAESTGGFIKYTKEPEEVPKYKLLSGERCEEHVEPLYGRKQQVARGLPKLQVRLVYDETRYPSNWMRQDYYPNLFVDEFWMTDDQLIKLNATENAFEPEVSFDLMSSGRWRFQHQMEASFKMNAELFGDDSQEMLQMRDLFANTHPYLLTATIVVSFLHIIFEFLAFKNDVSFFANTDTDKLNTYISIQSIVLGIFCQFVLMLYLYDEQANLLVRRTADTALAAFNAVAWRAGMLMHRRRRRF